MRTSSELLLTFLLNAVWQIALIGALASLGAWLLRQSAARYQHWLWVAALCLSLLVPAVTAFTTLGALRTSGMAPGEVSYARERENPLTIRQIPGSFERTPAITSNSAFQLNNTLALVLL